jgi:thioredoxin-related protein
MKKTLYILAILVLGTALAPAQEKVNWYTIEEAFQLSAKEPRILVIDVYTDWCGWCKRMDAATFSDPDIAAILNEHFYPVKLNAEGKEDIVIGGNTYKFVDNGRRGYHELAAIVTKGRLSYPTIACVDDRGRVLDPSPGYQDPDKFRVFLDYYRESAYETQSLQEFREARQPISVPDI